jgi:transcriptional regulator with XRE-family HTH domain
MTKGNVDTALLSELLHEKRIREELSLREAAAEIGTSAPTLQRVEGGQLPTAPTLMKLADWLGMAIDDLRGGRKRGRKGTAQQIEVFLRADPKLDKKAATSIANMVRAVYDGYAKSKETK